MTDNQDSGVAMDKQVPPTDRPLTAGDVHLLRKGDLIKGPNGKTYRFEEWGDGGFLTFIDEPYDGFLATLCTFVSRPATSAASEGEGEGLGDVERLVLAVMPGDGMCYSFAALEAQLEDDRPAPERPVIEAAVRLLSARGLLRFQRGLFNDDGCTYGSGYGLTDKGLAKQAALASPPVSERERELEAEVVRLREAGLAIYIYANDTLSGRVDGPDDRDWQRASVVEIRNRARIFRTAQPAGEGK